MDTSDIVGLLDYHGNQQMQPGPKQPVADEDKCAKAGWQNCFLCVCDRPRLRRRNQEFVIYSVVLSPDHRCLLPIHALITPSVFIRIVTLSIIHHRQKREARPNITILVHSVGTRITMDKKGERWDLGMKCNQNSRE